MAATDDAVRFADWVGPSLLAMTRLARRLAPHADPDDVVQDALVQAWQKWDQFDSTLGTPSNWLLAITADRARDARRKRVRRLLRGVSSAWPRTARTARHRRCPPARS